MSVVAAVEAEDVEPVFPWRAFDVKHMSRSKSEDVEA